MTLIASKSHRTSIVPPEANRVQRWEADHYGVCGNAAVGVYVDQVEGFTVRCEHHGECWYTATAHHAAELVGAPYAWCEQCRAELDATTARLLNKPKVWVATAHVRVEGQDKPDVYRVRGKLGQSRSDVTTAAWRTFRAHGVVPMAQHVAMTMDDATEADR